MSDETAHEASISLEDRVARIERILGLVPVPDCTMCKGTGEVNWGGSNRKNTGPCWCTTRPWQRRQW